jgi:hypothetical protein
MTWLPLLKEFCEAPCMRTNITAKRDCRRTAAVQKVG